MAFNRQTFKIRTLTAIVFVAVMACGLFINHWLFFVLFSVVHFGGWFEYQKLIEVIEPSYKDITPIHKYGVMLAGWCFMLWMCNNNYMIGDFTLHAMGLYAGMICLIVLPISEILFTKNLNTVPILYSLGGLLYISVTLGLLIGLRTAFNLNYDNDFSLAATSLNDGLKLTLCLIFSLWINDTMAYLVGSFIGKTPLSPISPKKTWEGTIGGVILCIAVIGVLFSEVLYPNAAASYPKYTWYAIAGIAAVTGTIGDLFESKLKRLAGVKDSGNFMPGHGGFLDRFDSVLFAIPFVVLFIVLVIL